MWKKVLLEVLAMLLPKVSESLKLALKAAVADLEKRAKETPNEFDDMAVALLKALIGE